jgi:hypothetical protein
MTMTQGPEAGVLRGIAFSAASRMLRSVALTRLPDVSREPRCECRADSRSIVLLRRFRAHR